MMPTVLRRLSPLTLAALAGSLFFGTVSVAQSDIENVIVETYYISDANDAVETEGGSLAAGSKTYRVFLDLSEGSALRSIYGDTAHPLVIASTELFFNNRDRGKSFGHQVANSALDENTVALDSWLSFRAASNVRFGVLKSEDTDGSDIAGPDNENGFLTAEDPEAGIPLTIADGLVDVDTAITTPPAFTVLGDHPDSVFLDSTRATAFTSDSVRIFCTTPGVRGIIVDNKLLIAQLTTTGDLSFQLNIEVQRPDGTVIRYVAKDTLLLNGETANGLLNYPPDCGCTNPDFLEYDPAAGCDDGSCATAIVFGCLDEAACNFNPDANFNLPALCCYGPDSCNGLDPQIVCPDVGFDEVALVGQAVFPNPTTDLLNVMLPGDAQDPVDLSLFDGTGRLVLHTRPLRSATPAQLDLSRFERGIYLLRVIAGNRQWTDVVVKN